MSDAIASTSHGGPSAGIGRLLPLLVLAVSMVIPWFSAGDHPLYSPDEGRYGIASLQMAEGGSWLVPHFRGEAHLKKPPLTYWSQAIALRVLGRTELAVRLPSLLASSLTVLVLYLTARRLASASVAALAVGTLAMMPLFVFVGRLGTTDAMLTFFWFSALAGGYFAIQTGRTRWAVLMWSAVALGWLSKGPLALTPIGILLLWLVLARRWGTIRRLHLLIGLPMSLAPIALWVLMVIRLNPEAIQTWHNEIVDRITGDGGAHPEPFWYYVPVFLAGLFPATAMLALPGWNLPWRSAWRKLSTGGASCLWALAVLGPLIMFSIMSGKLATYLLPLCPPLALLNGLMLRRWLTGAADRCRRPPEVVKTLAVFVILLALGIVAGAALFSARLLWWAPLLLLPPAACVWMWMIWKRRPTLRAVGLAAVWAAWMVSWATIFLMENDVLAPHSAAALVRQVRDLSGDGQPSIYTLGFADPTLSFYNGREARRVYDGADLESLIAEHDRGASVLLLIDDNSFDKTRARCGTALDAFRRVDTWQRTITHTAGVYVPADAMYHESRR